MPTDDQTIAYITNLLSLGVPTRPIAEAFSIDQSVVKSLQSGLRVQQYGTSEIAEMYTGLVFDAYDQARTIMHTGSPPMRTRMIGLIISRSAGIVGKQEPETLRVMRDAMQKLTDDISEYSNSVPPIEPDAEFSPVEVDDDE